MRKSGCHSTWSPSTTSWSGCPSSSLTTSPSVARWSVSSLPPTSLFTRPTSRSTTTRWRWGRRVGPWSSCPGSATTQTGSSLSSSWPQGSGMARDISSRLNRIWMTTWRDSRIVGATTRRLRLTWTLMSKFQYLMEPKQTLWKLLIFQLKLSPNYMTKPQMSMNSELGKCFVFRPLLWPFEFKFFA